MDAAENPNWKLLLYFQNEIYSDFNFFFSILGQKIRNLSNFHR